MSEFTSFLHHQKRYHVSRIGQRNQDSNSVRRVRGERASEESRREEASFVPCVRANYGKGKQAHDHQRVAHAPRARGGGVEVTSSAPTRGVATFGTYGRKLYENTLFGTIYM